MYFVLHSYPCVLTDKYLFVLQKLMSECDRNGLLLLTAARNKFVKDVEWSKRRSVSEFCFEFGWVGV